jgi:hypothetical protein
LAAATVAASLPRSGPIIQLHQVSLSGPALPQLIGNAKALVHSRRAGLYWDVAGAGFFMALFVAAAILI